MTNVEKINEIYDMYLIMSEFANGSNPTLVGWSDKNEQNSRFKILLDVGVTNGSSLLDYGCGMAHLVDYLKENKLKVKYYGIDINSKYITYCKYNYKGYKFKQCDLEKFKNKKIDWVIGSGVFSFVIEYDDVLNKIKLAYDICNKGVAFNFLDNDHEGSGFFKTYNSDKLVDDLSKIIQSPIKVIKGYVNNDFTIYIYK